MEALPALRSGARVGEGKVECPECGFDAYASSKPTASAVCLDDEGRVMLVAAGDRAGQGQVGLPGRVPRGGGASARLPAAGSCRRRQASRSSRSTSSASGWTSTAATAPPRRRSTCTGRRASSRATPEPADDVAELRWFAPAEISEDELAFPHTREVLAALRQRARVARAARSGTRAASRASSGSPSIAAAQPPRRASTTKLSPRALLPGAAAAIRARGRGGAAPRRSAPARPSEKTLSS